MKKIILASVFLLAGWVGFAQVERNTPVNRDTAATTAQETPDKKLNRRQLFNQLNLSKEQRLKMKNILQSAKSERNKILNDTALTDDQKQDCLKKMRKHTAINLRGILSEEQQEQLKALRSVQPE